MLKLCSTGSLGAEGPNARLWPDAEVPDSTDNFRLLGYTGHEILTFENFSGSPDRSSTGVRRRGMKLESASLSGLSPANAPWR